MAKKIMGPFGVEGAEARTFKAGFKTKIKDFAAGISWLFAVYTLA